MPNTIAERIRKVLSVVVKEENTDLLPLDSKPHLRSEKAGLLRSDWQFACFDLSKNWARVRSSSQPRFSIPGLYGDFVRL